MIEAFCDRTQDGKPVTREVTCAHCQTPFVQWSIVTWIKRLIASWGDRGPVMRDAFLADGVKGWVPLHCPRCESRELAKGESAPIVYTPLHRKERKEPEPPAPGGLPWELT